jgi:hypothetical protein
MQDCRPLCVLVLARTKLSLSDCPTSPSKMEDMSIVPYQSAIGSLMYAMVFTRPVISQAVGVFSRYMSNLARVHWDVVKRVFRYLHGTLYYLFFYQSNLNEDDISLDINGYVD